MIGYAKLDYPISPSQVGEFGYKGDVVAAASAVPPSKKKRQKKQEWQRYDLNIFQKFFKIKLKFALYRGCRRWAAAEVITAQTVMMI